MVVMCFRGGEERQVVATVGDCGVEDCHRVPEPGDGEMGAHDVGTEPQRQHVR